MIILRQQHTRIIVYLMFGAAYVWVLTEIIVARSKVAPLNVQQLATGDIQRTHLSWVWSSKARVVTTIAAGIIVGKRSLAGDILTCQIVTLDNEAASASF